MKPEGDTGYNTVTFRDLGFRFQCVTYELRTMTVMLRSVSDGFRSIKEIDIEFSLQVLLHVDQGGRCRV